MIKRFFRELKFLLTGAGTWCDGANWGPQDSETLRAFLLSETGTKLRARLRNVALSLNSSAVSRGQAHECGQAHGYALAIADIQTLSAQVEPQNDPLTEYAGDTGSSGLEHLAP